MINNNESMSNSDNQFFSNPKVPYCLKAGASAVLLHATVDYYVTPENQHAFMSMFFDKDIDASGKARRNISGSLSFTFGKPESLGKDNCQASIKQLGSNYPAIGEFLDSISDSSYSQPDEKVCEILAKASAERFKHNETGSIKNWELYVSRNIDNYIKKIQSHYPGLVRNEVFDNLKSAFENACKKKTIMQSAQQL